MTQQELGSDGAANTLEKIPLDIPLSPRTWSLPEGMEEWNSKYSFRRKSFGVEM